MQTFLPYSDFQKCAEVLDGKRLQKQIVECKQILNCLSFPDGTKMAWINHPAVKMWRGYEPALNQYGGFMQLEARDRGFTSNLKFYTAYSFPELPSWLGHPLLHLSQQANLVRKNPEFYGPKFPGVEPAEGYWWPVICGANSKKHTEFWENIKLEHQNISEMLQNVTK